MRCHAGARDQHTLGKGDSLGTWTWPPRGPHKAQRTEDYRARGLAHSPAIRTGQEKPDVAHHGGGHEWLWEVSLRLVTHKPEARVYVPCHELNTGTARLPGGDVGKAAWGR